MIEKKEEKKREEVDKNKCGGRDLFITYVCREKKKKKERYGKEKKKD